MVCKNFKREIDDDSIFCKWCGERQIRERKKKGDIILLFLLIISRFFCWGKVKCWILPPDMCLRCNFLRFQTI